MKFRELKLRKNPDCPVCGPSPTVTKLIDYEQFCGIPRGEEEEKREMDVPEITVRELKEKIDKGDVRPADVREPNEFAISVLPGSVKIPLETSRRASTGPPRPTASWSTAASASQCEGREPTSAGFRKVWT